MKLRPSTLLSAILLLACIAPAQTPATTSAPRSLSESPYKATIPASSGDLTVWPRGASPQEIGKAVAEHFLASHTVKFSGYPEVCTWYGALTFAEITHDDSLRDRLIARFDPMLPGGSEANRMPKRHHVDDSIFGVVPLQIAIQTKGLATYDPKYLELGQFWADRQWGPLAADSPPELPADVHDALVKDGLSPETRLWVDDMYMLTMLKYFWGRGDGWFAAGMAEMLRTLPADHPDRPRILAGYKLMMAALLKYQGADGMWRELLDHPEAWPESSSSAMFSFAMITGVKHGWLDAATFAPAARRGWIAVVGYVDQNYDVTQVCTGTGKLDNMQYYLDRKRETGNLHGQAPVLWAATALLRDEK